MSAPNRYNDDRPGMMRIHIAQRRARALCEAYPRDTLRLIAQRAGVPTGYSLKADLAFELALHGVTPPGYDREGER